MFIGHFGVGLAAKPLAPKTSLGTLFLAAQFIDLLWPTLLILGIEQVRIDPGNTAVTPLDFERYPVSHSLLAVIGWAVLIAVAYQLLRRYPRGAIVLGILVVSHWLLDLVVHRPDLPLYPGSARFGFGLCSGVRCQRPSQSRSRSSPPVPGSTCAPRGPSTARAHGHCGPCSLSCWWSISAIFSAPRPTA